MAAVMGGIRILEVAEHTFVPAAAGILADWGAEVVDIGNAGHINGESGLGDWSEGRALLGRLRG